MIRHLVFLFVVFVFFSCTFENEEEMYAEEICDTTTISYQSIKSIFEKNCVQCHNNDLNYLDIRLNTYENASKAAKSGLLYKAVNHIGGVTPMPFQQSKLSDCDVTKISIWIENGTIE